MESGLAQNEIHALAPILGPTLYKDLLNYIEQHKILYFSIAKTGFEEQLIPP